MYFCGTEYLEPLYNTSSVAGTTCVFISLRYESSKIFCGNGDRYSFSSLKSNAGGRCVLSFI